MASHDQDARGLFFLACKAIAAAEIIQQRIKGGWYKPSREVKTFDSSLKIFKMLKEEDSLNFLKLQGTLEVTQIRTSLEEATKVLDTEVKRSKTRTIQNQCCCWAPSPRGFSFPLELAPIIQEIALTMARIPGFHQQIEGIEGKENRLATRLPFKPDPNFVTPMVAVAVVMQALENEFGPSVVVIHGEPGTGKSSLVKQVGLNYEKKRSQDVIRSTTSKSFLSSTSPTSHLATRPVSPASSLSPPLPSHRRSRSINSPLLSSNASPLATAISWPLRKSGRGSRHERETTDSIVAPDVSCLPVTTLLGEDYPDRFHYGVFFIACGKGVHVYSKQLELCKLLEIPFAATHEDLWQQKPKQLVSLRERLRTHVDNRRALVILDDVWEADLVEKLNGPVASLGIQVKFLVTSQIPDIWEDTRKIEIGRLKLDEARMVLAHHIGSESGLIPDGVKEVADCLVRAAVYSPLVLANMAIAIKASHTPRTDEVKNWKEMLHDFEMKVASPVGSTYNLVETDHYRLCKASLILALESLPREALDLLIFTAAFEGPYVPEVVIRLLHSKINKSDSYSKFSRWKTYLEAWSLINIQEQVEARYHGADEKHHFLTWSMHSLRKQIIRDEKRDSIQSILSNLPNFSTSTQLDGPDTDELLATLCYIYGDSGLSTQAGEKLGVVMETKEVKRIIIEPFVSFLCPNAEEDWKHRASHFSTQIIVKVARGDELDDEALSKFLEIPQVADAVCMTLCLFAEKSVVSHFKRPPVLKWTVEALVNLFAGSDQITTQRIALEAFVGLAQFGSDGRSKNLRALAASRTALQRLEEMLDDSKEPICQCRAAGVLGNLSKYHEVSVARLMNMMSPDNPERIQRVASSTFAKLNLDLGDDNKPKLATFAGALERLVDLLDRDVPENVQWPAAAALVNLATAEENRLRMVEFPGVLEKLVSLLAPDVSEIVQHPSAWAIANLSTADANQIRMASFPGLLQRLISSLERNVPERVQFPAACALGNLTLAHDNHVLIAKFPRSLERFVDLLAKDVPENIQEHATKAFACMSSADDNKLMMAVFPNALPRLVGLLARDKSSAVQHYAAWALANLAFPSENRTRLASVPGALENLVSLLAQDVPEPIQQHATRAFANLAWAHENKEKMAFFPGALEGIVGLLARRVPHNVQQHAVLAFAKLAMADDEKVKRHMATFPGSLECLVDLLSGDVPENIQHYVAWSLASLAWETETKERLATHPTALKRLMGLLSEGVSGSVQRQAARALAIVEYDVCIDPLLRSPESLIGRGSVKLQQGKFVHALADFNRANELRPGHEEILWLRAFAKVKSTYDFQGALDDLNKAVDVAPDTGLSWLERGVLKQLMGDLYGALADLDKAMEISRNNYEILKHRGFVRYRLGDERGARADAERAILFRPMRVDAANYCNSCLGMQPVEFLDYKFK